MTNTLEDLHMQIYRDVAHSIGIPIPLVEEHYRQLCAYYRQPSNQFRDHEDQVINIYMNEWLDGLRKEYDD